MNKLIKLFLIIVFLLILTPIKSVYADFVNGASTSTSDLPFAGVQETLVLDKSQNQYFFDPTQNSLALSGDFTIEAWIKINQFYPGGSWIVTKDNASSDRQFAVAAADIQKIALQIRGVGNLNSNNATLTTNSWTHIATVWHSDTKSVDFYINGQFDSTSSTLQSIPNSGDNAELRVGKRQDGDNNGIFDGKIAEVRIWNLARNSSEIQASYNQSLTGNEPELLAYYPRWSTDPVPLAVPVLKQTNPAWNSQVYDTATVWNPIDPTIHAWGCALTSAAMVLKFHGINKMLDGVTDLDPGTLNTWLNSQEDGYIGNGLVNWLAISRFSKLARGINGVLSYDALEYNRVEGADTTQLGEDLNNSIPDILEEPGHFVVAKGITQTSFSINDPFYDDRPTLASYSGTFLSLGRFVPSLTDLSYIMIVLDTNIQGSLTTASGSAVGTSFIQNPIINPLNPSSSSSPAKRIIYVPKPDTGLYDLVLSSSPSATYNAQIFLYDENGNVILSTSSGILGNSTTDTITIDFKKSGNTSSDTERIVTFQGTIDDIMALRNLTQIKKEKLKTDLIKLMQKAEGIVNAAKFKKNELKQKFADFEKNLKKNRGKDMTEQAYQILLYDLQYLRTLYLN